MTSWEWSEANPFITRKAVDRLLASHQITTEDRALFDVEVKPESDGKYDSGQVIGWLGY